VSLVARRHGVAPNQLFTWRRLVAQDGLTAAGNGERSCQHRITEPCRTKFANFIGCSAKRPWRQEILKEALEHATGSKNICGCRRRCRRTVPDEGRSRGDWGIPIGRLQERPKKRLGRPPLPDDELVAQIKAVIAELPTYGYRRVHAILKRKALGAGIKPPNHKRIYRVMTARGPTA
jgi:putative transposase